jgi:hypothetical protein
VRLRNLPDQHAIVKRRGSRTVEVTTTEVKPLLKAPLTVRRFRAMAGARSPYLAPIESAAAEIKARQSSMTGAPKSEDSDDFWHDERSSG